MKEKEIIRQTEQLVKDKEILKEAKDHYEFRLNAKEGDIPQVVQSDQSAHEEEDPDDHDGEYTGWDDEEQDDDAADENENYEEEEDDEDDAANPDTSAVGEAFCPRDAKRKIKELQERNGIERKRS